MIGIFDSGVGGNAVLNEIRSLLPTSDLFYLSDAAHFPYGTKSFDRVIECALWCSDFLVEKGAEIIVIACNTASACALNVLRSRHSIPIIGMIQPLVETLRGRRIGLLATPTTLQTGAYQESIRRRLPHAILFPHPAPKLVEMIESGEENSILIQAALAPLKQASLDTLILGCTHFSLIKDAIAKEIGPNVAIKESGPFCAKQIATLMQAKAGKGTLLTYETDSLVAI